MLMEQYSSLWIFQKDDSYSNPHYNENNEGAHKNVLNADKLRLQLLLGVLVNAQEA